MLAASLILNVLLIALVIRLTARADRDAPSSWFAKGPGRDDWDGWEPLIDPQTGKIIPDRFRRRKDAP